MMETVKLPWQSIGHLLRDTSGRVPDRTLLVFEGETISYGAADARSNRIANVLKGLGLAHGGRLILGAADAGTFQQSYPVPRKIPA